jgi:hypothetical protein
LVGAQNTHTRNDLLMAKLYAMYLMNEEVMEFNATFNNIWAVSFMSLDLTINAIPLTMRVWIPLKVKCTRYNIVWYSLSVTCRRSVVFTGTLVRDTQTCRNTKVYLKAATALYFQNPMNFYTDLFVVKLWFSKLRQIIFW